MVPMALAPGDHAADDAGLEGEDPDDEPGAPPGVGAARGWTGAGVAAGPLAAALWLDQSRRWMGRLGRRLPGDLDRLEVDVGERVGDLSVTDHQCLRPLGRFGNPLVPWWGRPCQPMSCYPRTRSAHASARMCNARTYDVKGVCQTPNEIRAGELGNP